MSEPTYSVKLKQRQTPLRATLGHLDIEMTERCNNACIHCLINQPENDVNSRSREMDTAFVKDILKQAADLGCLTVRFTGGEPLLRDDFAELYLFARRLGMYVILFTNARLITPEIAQLLVRIPPGRVVEVTVYGMHAESYDAVAASRGAFAEFWRGIELLREHKIPFVVKQSVLPPNSHEIAEFEAFAATLPRMEKTPGYSMNFELRARRDNPAKNRFIEKLRLSPDKTVEMLARDPNYLKTMRQFTGKFMGIPGDKLLNCGAGLSVCVDAYGQAQMCMGLRHPKTVYDLRAEVPSNISPLKYALTEVFPRLREMRATNPDYLNRCARCFIKGLCEQCPAKSWQEHGTLDTPVEYLCEVAHAEARYLGLLNIDEHSWELEPEVSRARVTRFVNGDD
jgi:radical SAM protein with 4Fe4S-binding SPASM domain